MSIEQGVMVIGADADLTGRVHNCRRMEIRGTFEGEIDGGALIVHPGGRCTGTVRVDVAEIHGNLDGQVRVRNLIRIRSTGAVTGNVLYGSLALEPGGELSADVRNVPPSVGGDFQIEVPRGSAARVTLADLTAIDPDDRPENLTFSVTRAMGGAILAGSPLRQTETFTQSDLAAGTVMFQHDGSAAREASFDVVVRDAQGATSGAPRTVRVAVV